ncbi:MAG: ParB/RepB/Spo0J family partition protein [Bacillaceae bacterium]
MAKGLGRGIDALFSSLEPSNDDVVLQISLRELRPNPYQPRKNFDETSIQELKNSILEHGIIQPIVVRKTIKGYEILAGERRFRAAREAHFDTIPAIVREFTEQQMMELALLENLQREDLNPIEEGQAYKLLMEKLKITQDQLAIRVGKSRPHIANIVRLLSLPEEVKKYVINEQLSMGHARALLGCKNQQLIPEIVSKVLEEHLNVRQLEALIQELNQGEKKETKKEQPSKNVFIKQREEMLQERFGTSVKIKSGKKKGKIEIDFFSPEDLERILMLLSSEEEEL